MFINRAAGGTVRYVGHIPAGFRAAQDSEADIVNERNYVGLETSMGGIDLANQDWWRVTASTAAVDSAFCQEERWRLNQSLALVLMSWFRRMRLDHWL